MKISFITLGCSKNRVDSEFIMGMLVDANHQIVADHYDSEAIFINTCGFITPAKEEAIDTILDMAKIKEQTHSKIIVFGCLVQRYQQELQESLSEVDRFISLDEYNKLHHILSDELDIPVQKSYKQSLRVHSNELYLGYLKISEGCSNQCSFCAIPMIRGSYRSFLMEDLLKQVEQMAREGVRELVLIAQDTTMYGKDIYKKSALVELVRACAKVEGIAWVRVLYMYPDLMDETMVKELAMIDKFVPYFDIPIQHTQDKILTDMKRRGDRQQIIDICDVIRKTFEHVVIRTTLIVGYPSETQEDFEKMISFIQEHPFDRLGAFTFSKEEDTFAYSLEDLPQEIKQERYQQLMATQSTILSPLQKKIKNKTIEVVVEKVDLITKTAKARSQFHAPDDIDGYVYVHLNFAVNEGDFIQCVVDDFNRMNWYATQVMEKQRT